MKKTKPKKLKITMLILVVLMSIITFIMIYTNSAEYILWEARSILIHIVEKSEPAYVRAYPYFHIGDHGYKTETNDDNIVIEVINDVTYNICNDTYSDDYKLTFISTPVYYNHQNYLSKGDVLTYDEYIKYYKKFTKHVEKLDDTDDTYTDTSKNYLVFSDGKKYGDMQVEIGNVIIDDDNN